MRELLVLEKIGAGDETTWRILLRFSIAREEVLLWRETWTELTDTTKILKSLIQNF